MIVARYISWFRAGAIALLAFAMLAGKSFFVINNRFLVRVAPSEMEDAKI